MVHSKGVDASRGKRRIIDLTPPDTMPEWWAKVAQSDALGAAEKADIYGSRDFEIMGAALRGGVEHAIAFYALGKVARALSALERGDSPGPDTWADLVVYGMIARRVRDSGRWP